jgi:hypothetical protein
LPDGLQSPFDTHFAVRAGGGCTCGVSLVRSEWSLSVGGVGVVDRAMLVVRGARPVAILASGAIAAIGLTGCDSGTATGPIADSSPVTASTTVVTSSSAVSEVDQAGQAALAAYQGMWQDFFAAAATADWQSPSLGQHATGTALNTMTRGLYSDHYNGLVTKGVPTHDARVSSMEPPESPTKVIVTDCSDSTHSLKYRADNGQLADNTPGGRRLINGIVQRQGDGSWKVTEFGVHEVGSC